MRNYFKFFSALLIMVIGFNLFAEISHSSEINDSCSKNNSNSYQTQSHQTNDVNSGHSDCKDACHLGGCHVSHCAQIPFKNFEYIGFFSNPIDKDLIKFNFLATDSPFIQGLRRPPRIS